MTVPLKPKRQFPGEQFDEFLLADDDDWLVVLEPVFCGENGENLADSFARLLYEIITAIESGPAGIARAVYTLRDGIRIAYKYTAAHQAALQLYNLSLACALKPDDEPLTLITGALDRGKPRSNKRRRKTKGSSKR